MNSNAAPQEADGAYLDRSRLARPERIGMASGLLLLVSLWLPWFSTSDNPNSVIASAGIGPNENANAWETFGVLLPWLLVALSAAPFILAWIVARAHKLDWRTGEVTMVTGLIGAVLVLCNGIILGRPDPGIDISLSWGYLLALLACIGILTSGFMRQAAGVPVARKPPGVM